MPTPEHQVRTSAQPVPTTEQRLLMTEQRLLMTEQRLLMTEQRLLMTWASPVSVDVGYAASRYSCSTAAGVL